MFIGSRWSLSSIFDIRIAVVFNTREIGQAIAPRRPVTLDIRFDTTSIMDAGEEDGPYSQPSSAGLASPTFPRFYSTSQRAPNSADMLLSSPLSSSQNKAIQMETPRKGRLALRGSAPDLQHSCLSSTHPLQDELSTTVSSTSLYSQPDDEQASPAKPQQEEAPVTFEPDVIDPISDSSGTVPSLEEAIALSRRGFPNHTRPPEL